MNTLITPKKFYVCVIHPKNEDLCPTGINDCDHCEHCNYIGTFGGEYYIECGFEKK